MTGARILVVEGEPQFQHVLQTDLQKRGYAVTIARSAEQALVELANRSPDVMLVGLVLPGIGGAELTHKVRLKHSIPIIVLSEITNEQRKVEVLELGADDYVTRPFGMAELQARIRSVMRRWARANGPDPSFTAGELSVNFERREVRINSELIHLTPKEFDLMKYMIEHVGKALTHRVLLAAVWGQTYVDQTQYLRVFVGQLRRKIERNPTEPRFILTDQGVGYRFCNVARH